MRRWVEFAARLYPAKWQQRYGTEFRALLEELHPGWLDFLNVLGGALKMQLLASGALYLKLSAAFAVLGLGVAAIVSFAVPRQYVSSAVVRIEPSANSPAKQDELSDQPLLSAIQTSLSRTSLSEIIQRPNLDLYRGERQREPLEDVIEKMRHDLNIQTVRVKSPALAVRLEFRYSDRKKAQAVVNALIGRLTESFALQFSSGTGHPQNLTVLDAASMDTHPVSPKRVPFMGAGLALGALLGIITALYIRQKRRTLLISAMGVAGCVLAASFSLLLPDRYISRATLRIVPIDKQGAADTAKWLQQAETDILSRPNLAELIQRPRLNLYTKERANTPLEDVIDKIRLHDLSIQLISPGKPGAGNSERATAILISFEYPDRDKAQAMVWAIAQALTERNRNAMKLTGSTATVDLLDGPSLPQSPVFPNRYVISALGFAFGLMCGGAGLTLMQRRQSGLQVGRA